MNYTWSVLIFLTTMILGIVATEVDLDVASLVIMIVPAIAFGVAITSFQIFKSS